MELDQVCTALSIDRTDYITFSTFMRIIDHLPDAPPPALQPLADGAYMVGEVPQRLADVGDMMRDGVTHTVTAVGDGFQTMGGGLQSLALAPTTEVPPLCPEDNHVYLEESERSSGRASSHTSKPKGQPEEEGMSLNQMGQEFGLNLLQVLPNMRGY
mmetsp:Transcript_50486/g.100498  ORF Transcript_50486/g.100498 Transcript_50486/m.100498 type:complete len:157 (-) Transcript_50486:276-746(-)